LFFPRPRSRLDRSFHGTDRSPARALRPGRPRPPSAPRPSLCGRGYLARDRGRRYYPRSLPSRHRLGLPDPFGILLGAGGVLHAHGVDAWIATRVLSVIGGGWSPVELIFIPDRVVCVCRLLVPWIPATLLLSLALVPAAPSLGLNPWVCGVRRAGDGQRLAASESERLLSRDARRRGTRALQSAPGVHRGRRRDRAHGHRPCRFHPILAVARAAQAMIRSETRTARSKRRGTSSGSALWKFTFVEGPQPLSFSS
jgi:hypothetical protein